MWLIDNLLDDRRFSEAEAAIEGLAKADDTYRTDFYRGLLLWYQGKPDEAHKIWDKLPEEFPEDWLVYLSLADVAVMELRYDDAVKSYRQALEHQASPKYVDSLESMAMIYEIQGKNAEAVKVLEEELELLADEWDTTMGETADRIRRWIKRLK